MKHSLYACLLCKELLFHMVLPLRKRQSKVGATMAGRSVGEGELGKGLDQTLCQKA